MTLSSEVDIELGTSSDLPRVRTQSSISSRFGESAHEEDDQSKNLIQSKPCLRYEVPTDELHPLILLS